MSLKKFLLILISVVVVGFIVGFLYFSSLQDRPKEESFGSFIKDLFPFGGGIEGTKDDVIGDTSVDSAGIESTDDSFAFGELSELPVSGAVIVERDGEVYVRYMERSSGHIFDINTSSYNKERISNTTMLGINKVYFLGSGDSFAYEKVNESNERALWSGVIDDSGNINIPSAFIVRNALSVIQTNNDGIAYLYKEGDRGVISEFNKDGGGVLYSSLFAEWNMSFVNNGTLLLYPKTASNIPASIYALNKKTGGLERLLGPVYGASATMSPDEKFVLLTESKNNSISTYIYNRTNDSVSKLNITTLPEKCAWKTDSILVCAVPNSLPRGFTYPDDWYKGRVSFSDDIYEIDASLALAINITSVFDYGDKIFDAVDVKIGKIGEGSYLFYFINKKDLRLWGLRLDD